MTTKIMVVVSGGLVQDVYCTDSNAEVTLVDWDNIKEGPELEIMEQNNYPVAYLDDMVLSEKMEEVNKIIQKNIDWDVEQRR